MTTIITPNPPVYTAWSDVRRNYMIRPRALVVTGWQGYSNTTLATSTETTPEGTGAVAVTVTAAFGGVTWNINEGAGIEPSPIGLTKVSMSVKAPAGTPMRYSTREWDGTVGLVETPFVSFTASGEWERIEQWFTKASPTSRVRLQMQSTVPVTFWAGAGYIGGDGDYFDGATVDTPTEDNYWAGVVDGSASVKRTRRALVAAPTIMLGLNTESESRNIVHPILGRSHEDVTLRAAGPRTGTIELGFQGPGSEAASREAEMIHATPAVFSIFTDERTTLPSAYIVDSGGRITRILEDESRDAWVVSIPYREVIV